MKRGVVLGILVAAGAMSITAAAFQQGGEGGVKVVEVEKLKDNLFMMKGGGGNTAVFITANGVIVVDTKNPGWGQPLLDKIKSVTNKPIDDDYQHPHAWRPRQRQRRVPRERGGRHTCQHGGEHEEHEDADRDHAASGRAGEHLRPARRSWTAKAHVHRSPDARAGERPRRTALLRARAHQR